MKSIRVKLNIYGNYVVFFGNTRHIDFGQEFDVINYINGCLQTGEYKLSSKSDVTLEDVNQWRENIGMNPL